MSISKAVMEGTILDLRAEVFVLNSKIDQAQYATRMALELSRSDSLRAEKAEAALAECREDAERYKIMMKRENLRSDSKFTRYVNDYIDSRDLDRWEKKSWDSAIDAARGSCSYDW